MKTNEYKFMKIYEPAWKKVKIQAAHEGRSMLQVASERLMQSYEAEEQ